MPYMHKALNSISGTVILSSPAALGVYLEVHENSLGDTKYIPKTGKLLLTTEDSALDYLKSST